MEKLNVEELLKDCPEGIELDCTMYDDVFFYEITDDPVFPICIKRIDGAPFTLTKYGEYANCPSAKCVIFPKGKITWEGFIPPYNKFKDGDIIYNKDIKALSIFYKQTNDNTISHCFLNILGNFKICHYHSKDLSNWEFATEEEKQKLFQAIKDNGYKWNAETKTLEKLSKPRFKVGNRIKLKGGDEFGIITEVADCFFTIKCKNNTHCWPIKKQDDWELVPDKFDINTLKPFESRVLVRTKHFHDRWIAGFFSHRDSDGFAPFWTTADNNYQQCIPYEGNEHLLGTSDDCDKFFKTWE